MVITIAQRGKTGIVLFDRDENNQRIKKEIYDFRPYFYIYGDDNHKDIYNKPMKRIYTNASYDVIKERENYDKTGESSVKYTQRYLADKISIPFPKRNLRLCFVDIENNNSLNTSLVPKEITCVTFYDSYSGKYATFVWREDIKPEIIKTNNIIYKFNNEANMLNKVLSFINSTDPDLLIGFNINFDLSYIINRAKKLGIQPNIISPMNYTKIDRWGVKVYGRVVFDMKKGYKSSFNDKNLGIYNLNNIAKYVLGRGKIDIGMSAGELWRKDIDKLIEYNIEDVKLLVDINDKLHMIEYYDHRRRENGCLWSNVFAFSAVNSIAFLREAKKRNQVVPTVLEKLDFGNAEGADVQTPEAGLYDYMIFLDIQAEYPSFIRAANISPETIDKNGDIKLGNGLRFKSEPKGIVPAIIERQMKIRGESKALMKKSIFGSDEYKTYNVIQDSNKKLSASWYGLFNSKYFLLQNKDLTEAITWGGRELKSWSVDVVKENGYETKYSDTDGLFIDSKTNNLEEAKKIGKFLEKKINESYGGFCKKYKIKENLFNIEFERIYRKFFIAKSKKRYVGVLCYENGKELEEEKMIIKGYEIVRSDTGKICAETQEKIFKMIVEGKKKKDVDEYIKKIKADLKAGKYKLSDVGFPKPWKEREYKGKTIYHIEAAKYSNKYLGTDFKPGSRFMVVYIKYIPGLPKASAIAFNSSTKLPDGLVINWDKQITVLIDNKVKRIYEALNWDDKPKIKGVFEYEKEKK